MAWFKRNLFFVLSLVAGLILTGYCAWLFYGDLNATAAVSKDFQDKLAQYNALQLKVPYPSNDNINRAKADLALIKQFSQELHQGFNQFPTPPKVDDKGFSDYLETTIADLKVKASNSVVALPDNFAFGFADERGKLKYPPENLQPWMQQLGEIKVLCDILFRAKINSIANFRRVSVSSNDLFINADDTFPASISTNAMAATTPYKIEVRGFTRELAAVMEGLATSSNCFVVKNIVVKPAGLKTSQPGQPGQPAPPPKTPSPPLAETPPPPPPAPAPARPAPAPAPVNTAGMTREQMMASRRNATPAPAPATPTAGMTRDQLFALRSGRNPPTGTSASPGAARPATAPSSSGPAVPQTVLQEQLLYITLSVDAVRLN